MSASDGEPASPESIDATRASAVPQVPRNTLPAITTDGHFLPASSPANEVAVAPGAVVRVVMESTPPTTYVVPRTMQWSLRQLLQVLIAMAVVAALGTAAGASYGGRAEPVYAARSEFIYFLEDAVPDGFLREDRRILTQLVTIESEAVLAPVAREFNTTVEDVREAMSVDVIDLSEVVRLDVEDPDGERALALNGAVLARYQIVAEQTDRRDQGAVLIKRRDSVLDQLDAADQEALDIATAGIADVTLLSEEEALQRQLDSATARVDRLAALADNSLAVPAVTDDRATLQAQLDASRQAVAGLENQLLAVRTERAQLQIAIQQQQGSDVPAGATGYQQRDAVLSVREDSLSLEIDTISQRIRNLENLIAQSRLNQAGTFDTASIDTELAAVEQEIASLGVELVVVRTRRADLAQQSAQLPSLTRRIERLEIELRDLDAQVGAATTIAATPSPIEVLTPPLLLADPVGNPTVRWAALGFLASLPFAAVAGAMMRQRQRRQR